MIRDKAATLRGINGFVGKVQKVFEDICRKKKLRKDEIILDRTESILERAIELGKKGRLKIAPEHISISATANCNLKCVMCPGHAEMSGPKLSINEAEMLFCSLADKSINFGRPKTLDMTNGEPTLNRNLVTIYRKFKELFPSAKISMISNATIPVRGRIREVFELTDNIGLSMDGATAETYERIRKGSVYRNVVRNVKDIAKLKKPGVNCDSLQLMFVAMDQNIHELAEMVRLTHSVGIPDLFVQASEVRLKSPFNSEGQNIMLSLPDSELAPIVIEAKSEAERLGVRLILTPPFEKALLSTQPRAKRSVTNVPTQTSASPASVIRTCAYPWFFSPRIIQDNENGIHAGTVCCHMPHQGHRVSLKKRPEMQEKSIIDMYNSEFYWNIRADLLDGTLAQDACEGCQYSNDYQWTAVQLSQLEVAVNAAGH